MSPKKVKAKPMQTPKVRVEYSGALRNQVQIWAPNGYRWRLWSYGQYGLSVILEKLEEV